MDVHFFDDLHLSLVFFWKIVMLNHSIHISQYVDCRSQSGRSWPNENIVAWFKAYVFLCRLLRSGAPAIPDFEVVYCFKIWTNRQDGFCSQIYWSNSIWRVINDDEVSAGGGFPKHSHRNMEIISYIVNGALRHKDSTGSEGVISAGEIQIMSGGFALSVTWF